MKKLTVFLTCLGAWGITFAQNLEGIHGKVKDESALPLQGVGIVLQLKNDSTIRYHIRSLTDGSFSFKPVRIGLYNLSVQSKIYQPYRLSDINYTGMIVNLPLIVLTSAVQQLNAVQIEARKPFVEHRADKIVLNIENSIAASGGSILDALEKAPGVTVDRQTEQIKLNNKAGITVLIDGKTNFLSGTDITTLLSNMGSEQVASIELISNPSSRFDATGSAGIINIKLKRNKSYGTNGSVSLNTGQGLMPDGPTDLYRVGVMLMLNHRDKKWNVFGNTAFNRKAGYNNINVKRSTLTPALTSRFDQHFDRNNTGIGYMGRIGADYTSERTIIGVLVDANTINTDQNVQSWMEIQELRTSGNNVSRVNQQSLSRSPVDNLTANFNVKHNLAKNGANLTFDADYSSFNNRKREDFDAEYLNNGTVSHNSFLQNQTQTRVDVYAAKGDLVFPFSKTLNLEAGLKSSYVKTDNNLIFSEFDGGTWKNTVGKSNNFIYREAINAAYTSIAKNWTRWQIQLGLRAEHTHSRGNSVTLDNQVVRNYLSLFPTVFVSQKLTEKQQLRYSYSRRVGRPNYQQLNPFVFYMDPYALDEGNPYLKPQFTDNFEFGYNYKEVSFSLSYSDTRDMITQISQQNDSSRIVNVIRKNLGRGQNYSANIYVPLSLKKWWSMQNNLSAYFNKFDDPNLEGGQFSLHKPAFSLNTTQTLTLPRKFIFELNFWLNSPRVNGVERTLITQYALNIGLQKTMMDKKLKMRVGMDDVFLTNRWEGRLAYQNVNLQVVNRYMSRRVAFTMNYNFGNQQVKSARNRNTAAEDLKNRAN